MLLKKTLAACLLFPSACAAAGADATRIGRSTGAKAPEFQELYDYEAGARPLADATFPYEVQLHRAHIIMLAERGIVSRKEAAAILRGLAQVDRQAAADPALRSYLPYEAALIRAIGPVAGKLHTGRSRNDLAMVQAAARARPGRELPLTQDGVRAALDPEQNVRRRDGAGGPAPASVARMVAATRAELLGQERRQAQRKRALDDARATLARAEAEALRAG